MISKNWNIIVSALFTLGVLLHFLGSYVLIKSRAKPNSQKFILLNLACIDIICSISATIFKLLPQGYLATGTAILIGDFISVLTTTVSQLIMFCLIGDRHASICLHLKYATTITPILVKKILMSVWLTGFACAVVYLLLETYVIGTHLLYRIWCWIAVAGYIIIFIHTSSTYIHLYFKVRIVKKKETSMTIRNAVRKDLTKRKFLLPLAMVIAFFFFHVIGNTLIIGGIMDKSTSILLLVNIGDVLVAVGTCLNALIYMILQKQARAYIRFAFTRKRRRADTNSSNVTLMIGLRSGKKKSYSTTITEAAL